MTTLSTPPTQAAQFTAVLPDGIPLPKFEMFQRVKFIKGYCKDQEATVIGLYWVDHNTALMESITPGWHYCMSHIWGITDTQLLLDSDASHVLTPERNLEAIVPDWYLEGESHA